MFDMHNIEERPPKQSLRCCRGCLGTDCRLYDIHDHKADDAFSHLTDLPVSQARPQYMCAWCLTLLRKCASFRAMCVRTQQRLTEILEWRMDTNGVRGPSLRPLDMTRTEVIIIDCVPSESNTMNDPGNMTDDDVETDPEIESEIDHTNEKEHSFSLRKDINVNSKAQIGTTVKKYLLKIGDKNDDKFNADADDPLKISELKTYETDVKLDSDVEFDHKQDEMEINDEDADLRSVDNIETQKSIENVKLMTIETNRNKTDLKEDKKNYENIKYEWKDNVCMRRVTPIKWGRGNRKRTKLRIKDLRHPTEGYILFDFPSFERANAVKVVLLSKEEQLAEIASRKLSRNYVESPFKCEECGKGFLKEAAYTNHRTRQHDPSMEHPCEVCGMRFRWQCYRQKHQDTHRFKFICNECNFVSRLREQARAHHAMHAGKTFDCQHCGKSFKKRSSYFTHLRLAHPDNNVLCGECGETFVSDHGLRGHMRNTHLVHLKTLNLQKFECSTCSANFASVEALNRHTDTAGDHADLRPCEQCGENCASETELHQHVKEKHPTESHHCEKCNMTFASSAAYDTHHRRKHLGQRYSGPAPRHVQRHRKRHGHVVSGSCVCDKCGWKTKNPSLLVYHMRSHLDVKPFACPVCPKTLETRFKLALHMAKHTGEKRFQCADCPLAFTLKNNLARHQKVVHMNQRDCFICAGCGSTFTTKGTMKVHIKTVHEGMPWPRRNRKAKGTAAEDNK